MKLKVFTTILGIILLSSSVLFSQDKPAYKIYDKLGNETSFHQLVNSASESDVVLFGEIHNNAVCHWLQLEVTSALIKLKEGKIILGAEMFEADEQLLINEYLEGTIMEKNFEAESKLWKNYKTDYKPLMTLALENELGFIATNIPRRYANLVSRNGINALDSLGSEAKRFIAPTPINVDPETPGYSVILEMDGHGMDIEKMVEAQASKDATMAHFISTNQRAGFQFIHYNGDFHSAIFGGIYYYLKKIDDSLNIFTITTVENEDTAFKEEWEDLADFIIVIPNNFTKTY